MQPSRRRNPNRLVMFCACLMVTSAFAWVVPLHADQPAASNRTIDFKADVMPVLTKLGCNAGACHGSAAGRGGLKLSLYGSRPEDDFLALARDQQGRRINHAQPDRSLLLRKPGGELEHGGDQRFDLDDEAGQLLRQWILQGASLEPDTKLASFDVGPPSIRLPRVNVSRRFEFTASFQIPATADQPVVRDVSPWTVLTANDPSAVEIDPSTNEAVFLRPGRHILIARYLDQVAPIEVLIPLTDGVESVAVGDRAAPGSIDQAIDRKLQQLQLPAGGRCDDETFVRRLTLDLTGRLPTLSQVQDFLSDDASDKRERLIGSLFDTDAFNDYWAWRLANQLRVRSQPADKIGVQVYHRWLREQLADRRPWNAIARDLLLARGDSHLNGPANFYRTAPDARQQAEFISEALMGVQLRCANCHDHPLDRWSQDDYHGLAAVFATVKRGRVIQLDPEGENIHARTGKPAEPRIPGDRMIDPVGDLREPFADWLLGPDNPYFARAMVNRTWSAFFGRGLVDPVEDLRRTNPATHPQLLDTMAREFVEDGFDLRALISRICRSEAYQRSAAGPTERSPAAETFYAIAPARPLPAEVLADAIADLTGVPGAYGNQPPGTRAVQLEDPAIESTPLDILGRCSRESACDSGSGLGDNLARQLHLINGDLVNERLQSPDNRLITWTQSGSTVAAVIDRVYRAAYSRLPRQSERRFWSERMGPAEQTAASVSKELWEDFFWSVLNSREFTTNH